MQDKEQRCKMPGHKSRPKWQVKQPILRDRTVIYTVAVAEETHAINYWE